MKILLATDGSDHSALAEQLLIKLPGTKGADVVVATVTPTPSVFAGLFQPVAGSTYLEESAEVWSSLRDRSRKIATEAVGRLKAQGLNATEVLLDGDPGNELLSYSDTNGIDLVLVGSRGENAVSAALLGSVARKLVSHCKSSVLIARNYSNLDAKKSTEKLASKPGLSAFVCADESSGSKAAIEFIKAQGDGAYKGLTVFSVEPLIVINTLYDPVMAPVIVEPVESHAASVAEKAAAELAKSAAEVVAAHDIGRPASLIESKAAEAGSDLIIMGAQGHGALDRWLLGSVSFEIATTAPCSVLVVRP